MTSFLALVAGAWAKSGGEAVVLCAMLGGVAYLISAPLIWIINRLDVSDERFCNFVFWPVFLVTSTALACFAFYGLSNEYSFVVWTDDGLYLSLACLILGWIIGSFANFPFQTNRRSISSETSH